VTLLPCCMLQVRRHQERTFQTTKKDECSAFIHALQKYFRKAAGPRSAAQKAAQQQVSLCSDASAVT